MEERIHILIAKKLTGEASAEELRELDIYAAESNEHRSEVTDMEVLWRESDSLLAGPKFDKNAAWEKINASINSATQSPVKGKTIAFPAWTKTAIAAAAVLVIGLFVIIGVNKTGNITIVADAGDKKVTLPDNSVITLKSGGVLAYEKSFNDDNRNIVLQGEAFFEVARNEQKPFIINAGDVSVQVLGTSFYVKSGDNAYVAVVTGKVQVARNKNTTDRLILTPGETGQLKGEALVEDATGIDDLMYWKTGSLNFADVPLVDVVARLDKIFAESVRLSDMIPAEARSQVVSITFSQQTLEEMLRELCLVTQCSLQPDGNNYIIAPLQ
ncbi:MAG TPA: FecR domain-containing protein [Flavipsychrobacter sp.]